MKKRILLADDDESVRKMVGRVLESAGYEVALAGDGAEAAGAFVNDQADLALLDLDMPGMRRETFEKLQTLNPRLPLVAMVAWPDQRQPRGVDAIFQKPLDIPLLLQTIQELLAEPQQSRARRLNEPDSGLTQPGPASTRAEFPSLKKLVPSGA